MRKWFWLTFGVLALTACASDEAVFKSKAPSVNLSVPFFAQAPDANWELPWQEACEEASVILAYHYAVGQSLNKDQFRQEVLNIVDWEISNLGAYEHTNIEQTAEILKRYYRYPAFEILENPSVEEFKRHLSEGHVIIAPFAGRLLGNPFYSGEGPYYHMLVIKGYDSTHFITNDVGTRRGEDFIFSYDVLMNALHDWHDQDILLGAKKVIVVK